MPKRENDGASAKKHTFDKMMLQVKKMHAGTSQSQRAQVSILQLVNPLYQHQSYDIAP